MQEVCHKSPGSAITSEDLAVAVGGADDGDGDSSGGDGGGGGSDGGAYNSSAPGPVRNVWHQVARNYVNVLSPYIPRTGNGGGSCPRAYPKAEVSRLGWPLHFARVRREGSKIYIDDDAFVSSL